MEFLVYIQSSVNIPPLVSHVNSNISSPSESMRARPSASKGAYNTTKEPSRELAKSRYMVVWWYIFFFYWTFFVFSWHDDNNKLICLGVFVCVLVCNVIRVSGYSNGELSHLRSTWLMCVFLGVVRMCVYIFIYRHFYIVYNMTNPLPSQKSEHWFLLCNLVFHSAAGG